MKCELEQSVTVSECLKRAMTELQASQDLLRSGDLGPRVLSDFRDALNRIRNTAWAAQQFAAAQLSDQGLTSVVSLLAAERIRAAHHLCRAIRDDLGCDD